MIEHSITTFGYGQYGSIYEILTHGYPLVFSDSIVTLEFNLVISQDTDMELIR